MKEINKKNQIITCYQQIIYKLFNLIFYKLSNILFWF